MNIKSILLAGVAVTVIGGTGVGAAYYYNNQPTQPKTANTQVKKNLASKKQQDDTVKAKDNIISTKSASMKTETPTNGCHTTSVTDNTKGGTAAAPTTTTKSQPVTSQSNSKVSSATVSTKQSTAAQSSVPVHKSVSTSTSTAKSTSAPKSTTSSTPVKTSSKNQSTNDDDDAMSAVDQINKGNISQTGSTDFGNGSLNIYTVGGK